ncbi:GNAT family N-acetyltransferase [Thalassospira sp.]|uniref:GNAT family N-acetyltransferase n=1 Tax=Thalassospira sp. TaxID=1912094 RepID=UPI0027376C50|nr:GNAT family N-acetyltransferase [Thalassospira sp.]MDP2696704.1 GNAT family N-acetyltransferase [Thalassospira sp.]
MPTADFARELQTPRLLLSPPVRADIPDLYTFLGDPDAMQFTHHDPNFIACRKRVMVHEWFRRRDGFAPWVVRERKNGRIVGWGGLYTDPFDPGWGPELGYFLNPDVRKRGLGGELAETALNIAIMLPNLQVLGAFAHPDNQPSRKLLTRLGFSEVGFIAKMNRVHFQRPV